VQVGDNAQYAAVSQNIIGSFDVTADHSATATASATGGVNSTATAEIYQSQNISITQTNRSLNGVWWWGGGSSLERASLLGSGSRLRLGTPLSVKASEQKFLLLSCAYTINVSGDPTPEFTARSPFSWVWV
jgi:hypothetical protein